MDMDLVGGHHRETVLRSGLGVPPPSLTTTKAVILRLCNGAVNTWPLLTQTDREVRPGAASSGLRSG